MSRRLRAVMIVVMIATGMSPSRAQPPSLAPGMQARLDYAQHLNAEVDKLYKEGRFSDALFPASLALALREQVLGPFHLDVAISLNNLALLYQEQGTYAEAEPLLVRALDIREKALGPHHPDVATSLNNLAALYQVRGAYDKAEPLYTRALAISEKTLGPHHAEVATSLNNLAVFYEDQGAYAKAEPLLVRALDIRERALGPNHPLVAVTLNSLAWLYDAQGAYAKAEPLYVRALAIREKALGPSHPLVAKILRNLASLHQNQGAYAKAEPLYARALDINERALGPSHPEVARSLSDLAALYWALGAYAKAEPLSVRALAIFEEALGPDHPEVAKSLSNVAELYRAQGAYAKAESLSVRALAIVEKARGPNHPDVAFSLTILALLYRVQGAYTKAEPLYARALDINEKALGPSHPEVAISLNNLAELYNAQGAYAKAEPLLIRALDINEKALGPRHPDVAPNLNNLAGVYQAQGAYAKAEPLYVRALDIREKALGPTHPAVATSLNSLAGLYEDQGAHARAEPLYLRALAICESALAPTHPCIANSLDNLAFLYLMQGANAKAEPLLMRATDIEEQQLRNELGRLSETRKRDRMATLQGETNAVVSFHADATPGRSSSLELAFTTVLRRKGRILDSLADNQTGLRAHLTPRLQDLFDQLSQARSELVARLYAPAGPASAAPAQRDAIAALRVRIDELEASLSIASDEFRTQTAPVAVPTVRAALPPDTALVEIVRYYRLDARQPQQPWREARYVAYLMTQRDPLRWVALGDAAMIDAAVNAVLSKMDNRISIEDVKAALQRLDSLVLAPIRAQLPGVSHLIIAPDGQLNLVPFEALVDTEGHYALERYLVSYVTSGRDLLRLATQQRPRAPAVILAGPDYGPLPSSSGTLSFTPLAGATGEATDLREYFPTAPLTGAQATKAKLKALTGPAMLHIATHGFYGMPAGAQGVANRSAAPAAPPGGLRSSIDGAALPRLAIRDPTEGLDQSGFAMASANLGPAGLVTAREIAGFDWWGAQLVVLSACQSGVGTVRSGDGVYGLRRALVVAGTASQVVSLWKVSDEGTRALMRDYYKELKRGTGRAEALRRAQLRMLRQPSTLHPFYWAAFIAAGDWRPLDASVFSLQRTTP